MVPRQFFRSFVFLALVVPGPSRVALCGSPSQGKPRGGIPSFADDIQPLFQSKCIRCHGAKARKADLDLSTPAGVRKGGESGPVIVPGKPAESALFEKVHEGEMPPSKKDRLSESQVEAIRTWIEAGASIGSEKASASAAEAVPTQHDVIPIVLRHCTVCHGARRQEAGLDLRTPASMKRGGKSGPALVPGKPDESRLIKKIRLGEMPPPTQLVEASVKPVDPGQLEILTKWIAIGAPEVAIEPDVATRQPDTLVTDKDRDFWAFQAPRPVTVPLAREPERVRNAVDAFVTQKLREKGLTLSPEADRLVLIRRASFDLTGLPPEPTQVQAFLTDQSSDAYEKLIDRLLASPRYGEHVGRFWLDLAGYSDSEGKREQDLPRPEAWRYRDYVIRSFNADKPYDRFLLEQLAGDELTDYEHAPEITPEIYDNLVATGFLRMAPDASWANITGYVPDRIEVIADEIDVLGSAVMGLTLKCARCHSHKFDPIPQRDYYRLVAVFKGALDEYDWLKPDVRPGLGPVSSDVIGARLLPYVTTAETREWHAHNAQLDKEAESSRAALSEAERALAARYEKERFAQLPAVVRDDVRAALATAREKRTAVQNYLADKLGPWVRLDRDALKAVDAGFAKQVAATEARIATLRAAHRPAPKIQALWDQGEPSPTYLYRRGDYLNPGALVGPGVPSALTDGKTPFEVKPPWPGAKKTGRRLAFARWVTRPDHPLTARVAVNRIWKHHFGTGIVKTLGNFGKAGAPPTHPELLDWLAREFVQRGWSLKTMHRLLMTSATYRQSSAVTPDHLTHDPDNALYTRMPLVRLDAEALYDTLLLVAGRLDATRFGPADGVQSHPDGLVTPSGTERGWRRLIYVKHLRKQTLTHLENFDYPQMNPNCIERRDSIVALQALHLMNTGMVHELAGHFARRVMNEAGSDPRSQIGRVYWLALSRPPSAEESRIGTAALETLTSEWRKESARASQADEQSASLKALTTYCHTIMNSAGFLYVD